MSMEIKETDFDNEDVDMDSDSESNSGSGDDFNDEFQWFRQCYDAGSESFECLSNGPQAIPKDSPNYGEIKAEFENLFKLEDSSYDESNYRQFVQMAMALDELENIRQACELFCKKFTYKEPIVLSWLYRELKEFKTTEKVEILDYMLDIFLKALDERYSRPIVYKLAYFSNIYPDRNKIWDIIFEKYIYDFVAPAKLMKIWVEGVDKSVAENREEIVAKYEKLVTIPHRDMDKTYIDFKVLTTKEGDNYKVDDWEFIQEDYEKSQVEADLMVAYENELDFVTGKDRATMYNLYLKEVGDKLDRKVRLFLYERMVSECSEVSSCWLLYLKYLQLRRYDEKDDLEIEKVLNRALRLSATHEDFFISKMVLSERRLKSTELKTELKKIIELALNTTFQNADQITKVWLEYLTLLSRHTEIENEKDVEILRKNFDLAWDSLSRQWGDLADKNGEILKLQARLEYQKLNDPSQGRNLWNMVLGFGENSQKAGVWMEFIYLEEATRDQNSVRKLYKRALHTPELLDPDTIASAWIRFERVYGDQEQLSYCVDHCNEVLEKFYKQYEEETRRMEQAHWKQNNNHSKKKNLKRRPEPERKGKGNKRQKTDDEKYIKKDSTEKVTKPMPPPKAEKVEQTNPERDTTKDNVRVFLSNLDYSITEDKIREFFPELNIKDIDMVKSATGKSRGYCFVELGSEEEVKDALKLDRRMIEGRPAYISNCKRDKTHREKKFNFTEGLEPTKLFIKGCGNSSQDEIDALFQPFGKIKEIRLVYHKSGKSKGIAYVEYENEVDAKTAVLKMDGHELKGQPLSVSLSCPPPRQTPSSSSTSSKVESLGNAKRITGSNDMKPRLSFIPRSVLKKPT